MSVLRFSQMSESKYSAMTSVGDVVALVDILERRVVRHTKLTTGQEQSIDIFVARKAAGLAAPTETFARELEPMLTVKEIAKVLGVSNSTVTRLFEDELGVLDLGSPEKMHKRRYRVLRIPRPVYERVIRRLAVNSRRRA